MAKRSFCCNRPDRSKCLAMWRGLRHGCSQQKSLLHWSQASMADVFRFFRGQDYGVRGAFALDAAAKSGSASEDSPADWKFSLQGRAVQIHRWDLTERADNPPPECERDGAVERRRGEPDRRRNRGGGAEIESPRHVASCWRTRTGGGIAAGFDGDSGIGLVGLVSRVSCGHGGGCDSGTVFYRRDDLARVATCTGVGGVFKQWWDRENAGFRRAGANRSRERRPRARRVDDWAGAGRSRWGPP